MDTFVGVVFLCIVAIIFSKLPDKKEKDKKARVFAKKEAVAHLKEIERVERRAALQKLYETEYSAKIIVLTLDDEELKALPDIMKSVAGSDGNKYSVNLSRLYCTCPDYKNRRSKYPPGDVRRICKHQARLIVDGGLNTKAIKNKKIQAFVRKASSGDRGVELFKNLVEVDILDNIKGESPFYVLTPVPGELWFSVFWFTTRTWSGGRYNIREKRWAYGTNPFPNGSKRKHNWMIQQIYSKFV